MTRIKRRVRDTVGAQSYIQERVDVDANGCWLWRLAVDKPGYGKACYEAVHRSAHRLSFAAFKHDPGDLFVRHSCDVPRCCNPDHLSLGTHADNMRDMVERNRAFAWAGKRRGAKNPRARLSEADVRAIRRSEHAAGLLAREYGVSERTVRDARAGRRWGHVR